MTHILGLCGSLRAASINRMALEAARVAAPAGVGLALWQGLAAMPPFSPDLDSPGLDVPPVVAAFHTEVDAADGLLIACPEYAHGIPGAFKNALDWLVGSSAFPGKPVALLNVAPRAGHAQTQLREVLKTMSADLCEAACLTVSPPRSDDDRSQAGFSESLRSMLSDFDAWIARKQ